MPPHGAIVITATGRPCRRLARPPAEEATDQQDYEAADGAQGTEDAAASSGPFPGAFD
jgi:hypothetical protein